jgi:pimeloyl-ACP methyl ester carboxylesterase
MYRNATTKTIEVNGITFHYREMGSDNSIPVIYLNHLGATLDNCDPRIMDGIARQRHIIAFDNRGVGATGGKTPQTVAEMAKDAIAFIRALGYEKVDLVGFSLGGFVSQEILLMAPELVRKAVLVGTGPAGGEGIKNVSSITYKDMLKGFVTFRDPKFYLFFNGNANGHKSAREFLARLKERKTDRDKKMSFKSFGAQLKAIHAWGLQAPQDLSVIKQPVLVVNGDNDKMVPSSNSADMNKRIPGSQLIIYKDAGHGSSFQYHDAFVIATLDFLRS